MYEHKYLIIGGGMAAAAAMKGIREVDAQGEIGVLSTDKYEPYDRPPLSKQLWSGKKQLADIWREVPPGVTLHLNCRAESLDPAAREVHDVAGNVYRYDKLLLATGGTPRRLDFGGDNIIYYRSLDTYKRLHDLSEEHERFAVIGGGFIGAEIAAALAMNGRDVTMLFPDEYVTDRLFPEELAAYITDYYRKQGVTVLTGETAVDLRGEGTELTLVLESGEEIETNGVVAGIGITPNVELAEAAGLKVDNGIVVDAGLRTSDPNIFAAGDVANYHDQVLGTRRRVEHEDNANSMGEAAGRAIAGEDVQYDYSPYFYSDMFDLGYEAVGRVDSRLETVADWREPFEKGVIYYLDQQRVRGVLLWNVWDQVDAARKLLAEPGPFDAASLKNKL